VRPPYGFDEARIVRQKLHWCSAAASTALMLPGYSCSVGPLVLVSRGQAGLAPASVSEHAKILRRGGLTESAPDGSRVTHRLTPLGWALLLRSA
jgi:DNA-binding transcriptional ArsR family regulator